ncbi:MAG: N-acetyltransferase family protein, partial [Christensenellales bacterium]
IVSLIANDNEASIAFHRRCGFSLSGELDNVAFKLSRSIGIVFMKKRLVPLRITKKGQDDSDSCTKANRKAMRE